ncbi:MAG: CheB methylesterase domain-containing protein [Myxococcaceae bacterium]
MIPRVVYAGPRTITPASLQPAFSGPLELLHAPMRPAQLVTVCRRLEPDLVLLDISDPTALEHLEQLLALSPFPVLVLLPQGGDRSAAMRGLFLGALEICEVPPKADAEFTKAFAKQVALLTQVAVVTRRKPRRRTSSKLHAVAAPFPLVAIAASLGGPPALAKVLKGLPKRFKAPIVICQHITEGFADDLARWLSFDTGHKVVEVDGQVKLEAGLVYVAGSEGHLVVHSQQELTIDKGPAVGGFRPACDVLLKSAAQVFHTQCVGVVLTGMGRDGAKGLKEIRAKGGHTIAQDEATCVVYGMPGEAVALGAAEKVLPLDLIAGQLLRWIP